MKKIWIPIFLVVVIDIVIKLIISFNLELNNSIIIIENFFYLTYVKNTGAAWSIFMGKTFFLIIISLIVIIGILFYLQKSKIKDKLTVVGYGLLIGGALGNLIDRIIYGYVIDYLDFYLLNYHFPVFNLADSCIVIGAILIIIAMGGKDDHHKRNGRR